jgi:hypothetical protein
VLADLSALPAAAVSAQTPDARAPAAQGCTPEGNREGPTVGSGRGRELSDKLAESKGVICPPATGDREMQVRPPASGELKVIPPPGSPGGDQSVQPK